MPKAGSIVHWHRKVYLPTYGLFDEQRYFAAGERFQAFDTARFGRVGILICEDFWHLSAAAIMQAEEVDLLICMANSPARGVDGPKIPTAETYELIAKAFAQLLGAVVIVVNRVGFEDGLCFWGGSMAVGPDGRMIAQAPMLDESLTIAAFDPAELRRQRLITPLARDERLVVDHRRTQTHQTAIAMNDEPITADLRINAELVTEILTRFIRIEIRRAGFQRAVVGLSGGIDSSVVTYLCAKALGPDNVLAVTMPYKTSSEATRRDSQAVIDQLGVQTIDVPITAQIDAYFAAFPDASQMRLANKCARERMTVLYDQSAAFQGLVAGTSNKSELLLGYGTQFGDMASAINPIGDLYKTQLYQLAAYLGVPERDSAQRRPPAICGSARPTKASWASPTPKSIGCWCCWSIAACAGKN